MDGVTPRAVTHIVGVAIKQVGIIVVGRIVRIHRVLGVADAQGMDETGDRYEILRIVLFGHEVVAQRVHDGMLVCRVRLLVYGEQAVAQSFQQYGIGRHHRTERIGQFDVFVES